MCHVPLVLVLVLVDLTPTPTLVWTTMPIYWRKKTVFFLLSAWTCGAKMT